MVTKLQSEFAEPAIASVGVRTPTQKSNNKIDKAMTTFVETFVRSKAQIKNAQARSVETALKLDIEGNTKRIIFESENDPNQIKAKIEAYKAGLLNSIPESMRLVAQTRIDAAANIGIAQANKNVRLIQNAKIAANDELSQGASLAEWITANEGLYSKNSETVVAARTNGGIILGDFFTDLHAKAVDVDGNVIISPEEGRARLENFMRIGLESAITGWWRERGSTADDLLLLREGRGPEEAFEDTSLFAIRKLTDPSALLQRLEADLKFENALIKKQDDAEEAQQKIDQDTNIARAWQALDDVDTEQIPLTPDQIIESIEDESLTGGAGLLLLKATLAPDKIEDEVDTYNLISARLERGEDISNDLATARANGLLTGKTAHLLGKENQIKLASAEGVVLDTRKTLINQQRTLLRNNLQGQLDFQALILGQKVDPAETRRISAVMTEYNRRVLDVNEDPVSLQLELSERGRADEITLQTRVKEVPLPRGVVVTREEFIAQGNDSLINIANKIAERFNAGTMSKTEFRAQKALIMNWKSLFNALETEQAKNEPSNNQLTSEN